MHMLLLVSALFSIFHLSRANEEKISLDIRRYNDIAPSAQKVKSIRVVAQDGRDYIHVYGNSDDQSAFLSGYLYDKAEDKIAFNWAYTFRKDFLDVYRHDKKLYGVTASGDVFFAQPNANEMKKIHSLQLALFCARFAPGGSGKLYLLTEPLQVAKNRLDMSFIPEEKEDRFMDMSFIPEDEEPVKKELDVIEIFDSERIKLSSEAELKQNGYGNPRLALEEGYFAQGIGSSVSESKLTFEKSQNDSLVLLEQIDAIALQREITRKKSLVEHQPSIVNENVHVSKVSNDNKETNSIIVLKENIIDQSQKLNNGLVQKIENNVQGPKITNDIDLKISKVEKILGVFALSASDTFKKRYNAQCVSEKIAEQIKKLLPYAYLLFHQKKTYSIKNFLTDLSEFKLNEHQMGCTVNQLLLSFDSGSSFRAKYVAQSIYDHNALKNRIKKASEQEKKEFLEKFETLEDNFLNFIRTASPHDYTQLTESLNKVSNK